MANSDNLKTVLVLLSTYNGEKFLKEQLESLFRQQGVILYILVRDDGSSDSTVRILNDYKAKSANITVLAEDNIGCALSFNQLMNYAFTRMQKFDYYAFCDQDDVWDEDKLFCAVDNLEKNNENSLRLYTSAYRVVDEDLNFKYNQVFTYRHTLGEALIMINTLGCTQVFTLALLEQAIKIGEICSFGMPNHDGWLYLTAIVLNAGIYHDGHPHINYRQHSNNEVGANQSSFINRFKRIIKGKNIRSYISKILLETYSSIDEHNKQLLNLHVIYKKSFRTKIKLLFSKEMMTNITSVNIAYRILIIFNFY